MGDGSNGANNEFEKKSRDNRRMHPTRGGGRFKWHPLLYDANCPAQHNGIGFMGPIKRECSAFDQGVISGTLPRHGRQGKFYQ